MNPHTLQIEYTRVKTQCDDALALLMLALPYVEDCADDPAYKADRVHELARRIREVAK